MKQRREAARRRDANQSAKPGAALAELARRGLFAQALDLKAAQVGQHIVKGTGHHFSRIISVGRRAISLA
ncbi:hypothetical protein JCM19379_11970 [Methyloparacoccus murrellii]